MFSCGPPWSDTTTGRPHAWASSTTLPAVSVQLGNTNTSADAIDRATSARSSVPVNAAPGSRRASSGRAAPSPTTTHRCATPARRSRAATSGNNANPFSFETRPQYRSATGAPGAPPPTPQARRRAADRRSGENASASTPRTHRAMRDGSIPSWTSIAPVAAEGTNTRSQRPYSQRM